MLGDVLGRALVVSDPARGVFGDILPPAYGVVDGQAPLLIAPRCKRVAIDPPV
jgi:hypothetical protein